MPECKLGLNDRVLLEAQGRTTKGKAIDLEDIKFHQYVWLTLLSLQIVLSELNISYIYFQAFFLFLMLVFKLCLAFYEGVFGWLDLKMIEQFLSYLLMGHLI